MLRTLFLSLAVSVFAGQPMIAHAQQSSAATPLTTREELTAAATRADSLSRVGTNRERNALLAAELRERLRQGDFQAGDRIVLAYTSDVPHRDTLVVRAGGVVDLPWKTTVQVAGVLRSEIQDRLSTEVLRYVKAEDVEVTPLVRLGVLGEVARPGYFAFASDMPVTDVLMSAGGPTSMADMKRTTVRRFGRQLKSSEETGRAISAGLTLDQFGLSAGDELVIGQRRQGGMTPLVTTVGVVASLVTAYVALHRR